MFNLAINNDRVQDLYHFLINNCDLPHTGENNMGMCHAFKDFVKIANPKNILEIGFNRGSSALLWLLFSEANITSIDIEYKPKSVSTLKLLFPDRFTFEQLNSQLLDTKKDWVGKFDLIFVDGNHEQAYIENDIRCSLNLKPKFIALDDVLHRNHVQTFLELLKHSENGGDRLVCLKVHGPLPGMGLFYVLPE